MRSNGMGVLAFSAGCLIWVVAAFVYLTTQSRGFPDGYLTDLDRAEQTLAHVLIWVSVPVGLWLLFLGRTAAKRSIANQFRGTVISYVIFVVVLGVVDSYLRQHLDSGGGG